MASGTIKNFANDSGTGYCKMPDGTLIQWGEATAPAGAAKTTVTFSLTFINANYTISAMGVYTSTRDVSFVFSAQTATTIDIWHSLADLSHIVSFKWLAIGRWK